MKNKIMFAVICLGTAICFVAALPAQEISDQTMLTVNVPFNFIAGGMSLPAGKYEVLHVMDPSWIMLKSTDGKAIAVVHVSVSHSTNQQASDKLVFNRYQGKNFLSQIWTAGDTQVHECTPTSEENTLAMQTTKSSEAVAVAH